MMSSIQAALGISQLSQYDEIVDLRRENAFYLNNGLDYIRGITIPKPINNSYHVYELFILKLENTHTRDKLQIYLTKKGVMTKIYFNPIHLK